MKFIPTNVAKMLEQKLKKIKERVYDELRKRILEKDQYWQFVYQLLLEEGIVQGSYDEADTCDVTIKLATALLAKISANEYWGLEKSYVGAKNVKLSAEAQEDLKKFSKLESMTRTYLNERLGNEPISKSELNKMVEAYLMEHTGLPSMVKRQKQIEATARISVHMELEFNVQEGPEKIGRYYYGILKEALKKA